MTLFPTAQISTGPDKQKAKTAQGIDLRLCLDHQHFVELPAQSYVNALYTTSKQGARFHSPENVKTHIK